MHFSTLVKQTNQSQNRLVSFIKSSLILHMVLAWCAGASFVWALAPYGVWGITLPSVAILYTLLLPKMSHWRAFLLGEMYGFGLWSVGGFWLYTSIHEYGSIPSILALIMIALMGLIMGLFHGGMAFVFNRFVAKQPLSFAALWVVQEWLKTWVLTGFPWLFVGYAFTDTFIASLAPVVGVFGLSFLAVLTSVSIVEMVRKRIIFIIISLLGVLTAAVLFLVNPLWTHPVGKTLSVSLIQGNIPQNLKWLIEYRERTLMIYEGLSQKEWGREIVVWPEASIPMFQTDAWPFIARIAAIAKTHNTTWITGVPYQDLNAYQPESDPYPPFYNSVVALGQGEGLYKKQRLVPFGEYIPFSGALDILPNLAHSKDIMNFSRGDSNQEPLQTPKGKIGAAICYEVAYPDTTRDNAANADLLLTISNDAWFGTSAGPLQHLQMVQMRSLETGRWFIRATNTGVTAIINQHGHIVGRAPQFQQAVLRGDVPLYSGKTPFVRFGSYPILILCALLLLLSALSLRQSKPTNRAG